MNVDGVGLLRAEFMIANIGIHPKEAIKNKVQGDFVKKYNINLSTFRTNYNKGMPLQEIINRFSRL